MNQVMYFSADMVATSPLKMAAGGGQLTDSDVLVDSAGVPFVPGSTIAGVMRAYVRERLGADTADYWFGCISGADGLDVESRFKVYDAFPPAEKSPLTEERDGVGLDEFKTVKPGAKYDYQVVSAGAQFGLRYELWYDADQEQEARGLVDQIAAGFNVGDIALGGKTSRGFGRVELANAHVLNLDLTTAVGVDAYVDFDWAFSMEAAPDYEVAKVDESARYYVRKVPLEVDSFLLIRDYGTTEKSGHEEKYVDAETLKRQSENGAAPIVPGTSWAGAFRSHMYKLLRRAGMPKDETEGFLDRTFGNVKNGGFASRVLFDESVVCGAQQINRTRNAIDRFSGGAADKKLFTNQMSYGGSLELTIRWRRDMDEADAALLESLIDVCVSDLDQGLLAVGGMTAVGGGLIKIASDAEKEACYDK